MSSSNFERLLSPGRIGGLQLPNRILMTPMGTNQERSDGRLGEGILRYYEERARGGVGCVIAGVAAVTWPDGACNPNQAAISDDRFLPDWEDLATRVQRHGSKLAVQLQHASKVAQEDVKAGRPLWVPSIPARKGGDLMNDLSLAERAAAAAPFTSPTSKLGYREMTVDDIHELTRRFADAAGRAQRAGVDAVELHAGHGYMLSSFLSPAANRREDDYGGSHENRARFLVEVIRAVRERVGPDFAVWCRIDGCEFRTEGGISPEDGQETAAAAEAAGADAIHVSAYADPMSAIGFTDAPLVHEPSRYLPMAAAIKKRVGIPVIGVGRITPTAAEAALAEGQLDFVAMGRALLADPTLPNKLAEGDTARVRPCIYSYRCVSNAFLRKPSRCTVNPEMARETEFSPTPTPAAVARRVTVVGGGPIGLELARRAAQRGHEVTLLERNAELGGRARIAGQISEESAAWLHWLVSEARHAGVQFHTNTEGTAERVSADAPDRVFVATGARRENVAEVGPEAPPLYPVEEVPEHALAAGSRVAVLGDDVIAIRMAEVLAGQGHAVYLLGAAPDGAWAPQVGLPRRWRALHALREAEAELVLDAGSVRLAQGAVHFHAPDAEAQRREVDAVYLAQGLAPSDGVAKALEEAGLQPERVGDCQGPLYLQDGLLAAARLAAAL